MAASFGAVKGLGSPKDTTPGLHAAGLTTKVRNESSAKCLHPEPDENQIDPAYEKYRKSFREEPGKRIVHYGIVDDVKNLPRDKTYGHPNNAGLSVQSVVCAPAQSELLDYLNERKEAIYHSHKREPLGQSFCRGHALPEKTKDTSFSFGQETCLSESSKNLVYPVEFQQITAPVELAAHNLYLKSHSDYAPGEQRRRGYNWKDTPADPETTRFGLLEREEYKDGVAKAMNPDLDFTAPKAPHIVSSRVKQVNAVKTDELGKCRNLGMGDRKLPEDHTFGIPSQRFEDWNARQCLSGGYSVADQMPDPDVGRCNKVGLRNYTTETRAFGCPTVRTDVPRPAVKSVADNQNYGDEPNAKTLLYPSGYNGVSDEDFLTPYSRNELKKFVDSAGVDYGTVDTFDRAFDSAQRRCEELGMSEGVCIDVFRRCLMEI